MTGGAALDQRVEVGTADAYSPTDVQRRELALVDPLSGLPVMPIALVASVLCLVAPDSEFA